MANDAAVKPMIPSALSRDCRTPTSINVENELEDVGSASPLSDMKLIMQPAKVCNEKLQQTRATGETQSSTLPIAKRNELSRIRSQDDLPPTSIGQPVNLEHLSTTWLQQGQVNIPRQCAIWLWARLSRRYDLLCRLPLGLRSCLRLFHNSKQRLFLHCIVRLYLQLRSGCCLNLGPEQLCAQLYAT